MDERDPGRRRAEILRSARTVAVIGAHPRPGRPAHYVPDYLARHGYRILPVNPLYPKHVLWGASPAATLEDLGEPVDLVVVFRRSEHVPEHVDDVLRMRPRPTTVWLQQGIRHQASAARLRENGIEVVQDACTMIEHRRMCYDGPSRQGPADDGAKGG